MILSGANGGQRLNAATVYCELLVSFVKPVNPRFGQSPVSTFLRSFGIADSVRSLRRLPVQDSPKSDTSMAGHGPHPCLLLALWKAGIAEIRQRLANVDFQFVANRTLMRRSLPFDFLNYVLGLS
jgi:hypothetical protein